MTLPRVRFWSSALLYFVACLFAFAVHPCVGETNRTLVAIKTHAPTQAMLKRWCHLSLEAKASSSPLEWALLYMLPDNQTQILPLADTLCQQKVYSLDRLTFDMLLGGRTIDRYKLHRFNALVEYAFFIAFHDLHSFDYVWVFEQDVAWQGNLFDILGNFNTWEEDYLCVRPGEGKTENPFLGPINAGFTDEMPATYGNTTFVKCYKQFARYSHRLLRALCEEVDTFSEEFYESRFFQDEFWAPTVCKGQLARKQMPGPNCTIRGMMSHGASIFDDSFCAMCPAKYISESEFSYAMDKPGKVFHPAKF